MLVPLGLLLVGLLIVAVAPHRGWWWVCVAIGCGLAMVAGLIIGILLSLLRTPRLAYQAGDLLVYLRSWRPERVPVEHVECFFLGQGTSDIPIQQVAEPQTATIVIRLAEAAKEYHQREVKPALGQWCGGYIVLRGTWCEPINASLLRRLNQRLVQVQRDRRQANCDGQKSPPGAFESGSAFPLPSSPAVSHDSTGVFEQERS